MLWLNDENWVVLIGVSWSIQVVKRRSCWLAVLLWVTVGRKGVGVDDRELAVTDCMMVSVSN